ncbi:MAG: 2-amino-4-hydroxy-6-hydroxymethyldihydropteridine diphosphokinase, partial [Lachnospiraceae bacterium]|nr:2-amino-4-hydroxy-6-hydroxymethyldihydropteridine diphosphokinase [Lachnospiraceae bacterium]
DFIETEGYGITDQPKFLNTMVKARTLLTPRELLDQLNLIEDAAGRTRDVRWGPRTLDLDIIFYDKLIYEDNVIILPHVDLENRYFVLKPLSQLAPNFRHPILGKTVTQMLDALETRKN